MTTTFLKKYKVLGKVGEGSFSEVLKCQDRETGAVYAAKRLKKVKESITDALKTPEVVAMRKLKPHPNILQLIESHFDPFPGKVTLIFELMEMSMYDMLKNRKRCLPEIRVKNYLYQLMKGVDHLHRHGLFHRDIKPENILIKNEIVKLADLGSVRGIYGKPPFTEYISTRWYRSPECLLTTGYYGPKMDVWATGCVFFELLTLKPLFPGSNEMDQINKIHAILGTPSARLVMKFRRHKSRNCECYFPTKAGSGICSLLPNISENGRDILKHMLIYDPEMRPNTRRLLEHRYFNDLREDDLAPRRRSYSVAPGPTSKEIHNPALLSYIATEKRKKSKRTSTNKTNEAPKLPRVVVSSPNHRPAQTIIHSGRQMPANPQLSNLRPQKAETMLCVQEKRWAAPLSKKSSQQMLPRRVRGQVTIPNDGRIHLPPIEVKQTQKTTNLVQSTSIRRGASTIPSLPSIQTNVEKITTSASFLSLPPLVKKTEPLLHRIFPPSGSTNKLPFSNSSLNGLRHIHEKRRLTTIEEHPTSSPPNKNQRQS